MSSCVASHRWTTSFRRPVDARQSARFAPPRGLPSARPAAAGRARSRDLVHCRDRLGRVDQRQTELFGSDGGASCPRTDGPRRTQGSRRTSRRRGTRSNRYPRRARGCRSPAPAHEGARPNRERSRVGPRRRRSTGGRRAGTGRARPARSRTRSGKRITSALTCVGAPAARARPYTRRVCGCCVDTPPTARTLPVLRGSATTGRSP